MDDIEKQIEEARVDLAHAQEDSMRLTDWEAARARLIARAEARLRTLEAVRDGRMVPVYATVSASADGKWIADGNDGWGPYSEEALSQIAHAPGDSLTILRGYAVRPRDEVTEIEAESEVVS